MPDTFIPIPVETVSEAEELPSRTYCLDLDKGRISGKVDGLEAVNQAIRKAIITPRFKCLIYDSQYGSELESAVIAKDAAQEYVRATAARFIKDALLPDTRVLSVDNVDVEFSGDGAHFRFCASTIFGDTEIEEVI